METTDMLDGFEYVPADGTPFITLDKQRRFYLNTTARKLIVVKPYDRLVIRYNPVEKALAIVKPEIENNMHAAVATYFVDKRFYMSARRFANEYGYTPELGPYEFIYERGSEDGNIFIFRLINKE